MIAWCSCSQSQILANRNTTELKRYKHISPMTYNGTWRLTYWSNSKRIPKSNTPLKGPNTIFSVLLLVLHLFLHFCKHFLHLYWKKNIRKMVSLSYPECILSDIPVSTVHPSREEFVPLRSRQRPYLTKRSLCCLKNILLLDIYAKFWNLW